MADGPQTSETGSFCGANERAEVPWVGDAVEHDDATAVRRGRSRVGGGWTLHHRHDRTRGDWVDDPLQRPRDDRSDAHPERPEPAQNVTGQRVCFGTLVEEHLPDRDSGVEGVADEPLAVENETA
jgi:hypothetical protein